MSDKRLLANVNVKILDWWVKWWGDDDKHTVCLTIEINDTLYFMERELENE